MVEKACQYKIKITALFWLLIIRCWYSSRLEKEIWIVPLFYEEGVYRHICS